MIGPEYGRRSVQRRVRATQATLHAFNGLRALRLHPTLPRRAYSCVLKAPQGVLDRMPTDDRVACLVCTDKKSTAFILIHRIWRCWIRYVTLPTLHRSRHRGDLYLHRATTSSRLSPMYRSHGIPEHRIKLGDQYHYLAIRCQGRISPEIRPGSLLAVITASLSQFTSI